MAAIVLDALTQTLDDDCVAYFRAFLGGESCKRNVIAESERHGHLGRVEKVRRIEIWKRRHCKEFLPNARQRLAIS